MLRCLADLYVLCLVLPSIKLRMPLLLQ
uniref:Uncharacterized protein n=1 Tax=Arundo donax TaxID=35708 RepID=A0A0A9D4M0_ARUDO